jgi:shikimate dehydrogenase
MIRFAAVIGHPVKHSLSPAIFRAFSEAMRAPLEYTAIDVRPEGLAATLDAVCESPWVGLNVTLPHKEKIVPLLDRTAPEARVLGAVNVVRFRGGKRSGYNTDVAGFMAPLKRQRIALRGKASVVLGAGGASRAVCAALKKERVGAIHLFNRTPARAARLAREMKGKINVHSLSRKPLEDIFEEEKPALVVNATSAGLDGRSSPLPRGVRLPKEAVAYDLIYRPRWTPFLRAARKHGCEVVFGLGMLVAQAAETWKIWFGKGIPGPAVMRIERVLAKEFL